MDDESLSAEAILRKGARLGQAVIVLAETGSTNDELRAKAEEGSPEGLVIVAEVQSRGRGRLGRRWESPAGANLLMSVLLRPALPAEQAPRITLMAGVAVARSLAKSYGLQPRIKWPNDVLIQECKVAGILAEMKATTSSLDYLILGIGVNLNLGRDDFPEELRHGATSVREELGRPVSRVRFARTLLEELENYYGALLEGRWPEVLAAWHDWAAIVGQEVRVKLTRGEVQGPVRGVDEDGALRVWDRESGLERRILAGDVRNLAGTTVRSPLPTKGG